MELRKITKNELFKEIRSERVDGLYVRTNYSDYEHWVNLESIEDLFKKVEVIKEQENEL